VDLSSLTGLFVGAHLQLAAATQTPELVISDDEGKQFLNSAQDVLRHYSVETTQKTIDWIAFIGSFGMMYGTRYIAISNRHARERKERGGERGTVVRPLKFNRPPPPQRSAEATPSPAGDPIHGPLVIEPQFDGENDGVNG
jgi:hypothetical protein